VSFLSGDPAIACLVINREPVLAAVSGWCAVYTFVSSKVRCVLKDRRGEMWSWFVMGLTPQRPPALLRAVPVASG
jgi:hypothetical protein